MQDATYWSNLWLLNSLLHDGNVQGEEHAGDKAGLGARQLLHQGIHLLTHLLAMLLLEKDDVKRWAFPKK